MLAREKGGEGELGLAWGGIGGRESSSEIGHVQLTYQIRV